MVRTRRKVLNEVKAERVGFKNSHKQDSKKRLYSKQKEERINNAREYKINERFMA